MTEQITLTIINLSIPTENSISQLVDYLKSNNYTLDSTWETLDKFIQNNNYFCLVIGIDKRVYKIRQYYVKDLKNTNNVIIHEFDSIIEYLRQFKIKKLFR